MYKQNKQCLKEMRDARSARGSYNIQKFKHFIARVDESRM